jgi:hypothetical protein
MGVLLLFLPESLESRSPVGVGGLGMPVYAKVSSVPKIATNIAEANNATVRVPGFRSPDDIPWVTTCVSKT